MVPVGFVLQPDPAYLELCGRLIAEEVDYYEVAPETTWREDGGGSLVPNGFFERFRALGEAAGRPFVAHGVGLSIASSSSADAPRTRRWLARIRADHAAFDFLWYTDHLGVSAVDGLALTLPLAVPPTPYAAAVVRRRLASLQRIVDAVGVENTVLYYVLGDPLEEPA